MNCIFIASAARAKRASALRLWDFLSFKNVVVFPAEKMPIKSFINELPTL